MRKTIKHKTAFLTKLAFAASYGNGIPIYVAILIEIISYSQILYIILTTSFSVSNEKNLLIFPQIRDFLSFLGLFEGSNTFETEISTELVWYAISIGLLAYTLFLTVLAILCRKEKNLKKGIVILCTVLTTVHSKLLFCPIYYFYINSILDHEKCTINNESLYMCGSVIKAFTLVFVMINAVLAVLKEAICYQSYMNRNPFATKNNFHSLIQLIHKITVLPIIVLTSDSLVPASILNLFFTLPCLILLLLKLPHYNIKFLRTNVYLSTITATIPFILIWKPLVTSRYRIFELLIILVVPVFIKVVHESLNAIFEKILSLRAITPEHVMHLYALTEQYIFHSGEVDVNRNSKYKTLFKYGVLKVTGLDVQAMENVSEIKNFKDEINLLILGQLLKSYKLNPRSRPLLIFIIQFYMQKIKNASQAVIFIEKMQNMALPIPIQSALVKIKDKLKSIMFIAYSQKDPSLEFINYFKYREISETLKANILSEVQMHVDFWQIISKNKVKASKIIRISEKINVLALKVQKMWEQHEKDLIKNFPVPIILYKVYLSLIRGVPHIAETYTDISIGQNDKVLKSMEKWFSQEKASIVGSIQKGTLGIVLDASHSVQNLFNIKKEDLIGRNVNILMPSMFQEKHNFLIDRYNQKPEYTLDVKNNVYCKTVDGQFFDARFELKVYPYIDKGIGLIGMLTKKHDCELMLFLDTHGNIVDCSSEILNEFRSNFTLNKHINIEEIAPELKKTNDAFNIINIPKSMVLAPGGPGLIRPKSGIESASVSKSKFSSKIVREDTQAPKEQRGSVRQSQIFTFEPNLESAARLISTRQTEVQKTDGFIQQTTERDQIMSPLETNPEPFKFKEEPEVVPLPKSKNIAALFLTHITTKHSNPVSKEQVRKEFININEAEKICGEVSNEKEKKIAFFKQDPLSNTFIKSSYFVKIDLLWFENQFYKVVKVRKPTAKDMTLDDERTPRWQVGSKRESQLGFKSYGHSLFDNKLNKNDKSLKLASGSYSGSIQGRKGEEEARNTLLSIEAIIDREEENPKLLEGKNSKETKREANTKVEKVLNDLLRKGEESMLTKVYFAIFYFSMFLMLVLATVDFVITRNSFRQIELGARLVDADGERFISLTKLWAMSNSVYTFILQNKTIPASLEYTPLMNHQADIIRTNSRELGLLLLDINSEEIITAFYQKSIHFWDVDADPEMSIIAYNVFDGINIMLDKLLDFTASKRSVFLDNPDAAVFALNNSANDLGSASLNEMTVAMQVSADIYNSNAKTLMVLLGIEIAAMGLIFLSLVALAFKIKNTQGRLFIVLSTISARNFEIRTKELIQFRNNLEESLESRKFIRQLNTFLEEDLQARNQAQAKEFKLRDKTKFSFFSIKVRNILMLIVALVLFFFILALQSYASRYATQAIDKLKKIDAAAYLAKTMGYEVNVLQGNFIYMLNFLFRADVKVYGDSPLLELYYNLGALTQANSMLLQVFTSEDNFYNPVLDQLLHSNACPFLDPAILNYCKIATKGEILGLLGVNLQLLDITTTYAELFLSNTTPQNADDTVYAYIIASTAYIATADRAYGFMRANLMQTLLDTITKENETNQPLYIGTCVVCLIVAFLVRLIVLENFRRLEISKYKILMIIPQTIVLNNKAIVMYLKNEFKRELKALL